MNEFKECEDCVWRNYKKPSPCDSCEQNVPTNFAEEKADDFK